MWKQADKKEMRLYLVTSYGWCFKEGELKVEWDTESNIGTIRARVHALRDANVPQAVLLTAAAVGDKVISVPLDVIVLIVQIYSRVIPTTPIEI